MTRFKVFFLNSILMMLSSFLLQVIRLSFNIYISNKVTPETLGVFHLIMITYMFGITLSSSGISITCMKIISEEYAYSNNSGVKKASRKCIQISLLFSILASFIFFINSDFIVIKCFKNMASTHIVNLICIALPLISVSSAISGYFLAVRRVYKTVIGQFLEQLSKIFCIIILFNLKQTSNSIESICFILILGDVFSEVISFLYSIIVYIFDIKYHFSINLEKCNSNFILRIFKILLPISITSCIKSGISSFKQIIVPSSIQRSGKKLNDALSDYGIISGMAMPIVMFPSTFLISVSSLLIPEFSRYYVKKDYKKIIKYSDKLIIFSFLFACILTMFFLLFGSKLGTYIYHNENVGIYIKLFSLLIPFIYVDIIIDNILKGLDAQANVMIINIIDLLFSTTFIIIFVPMLGIKGYILSIFISEILNLSLSLHKLIRLERSWHS